MSIFRDFPLDPSIRENLKDLQFEEPTPIQQQVLPLALEGKDILGQAKTGTGKTAAFGLPIIQALLPDSFSFIRALIIVPTRELAFQVHEHFQKFCKGTPLHGVVIVGGEKDLTKQAHQLTTGADWVVATPGRLLDHLQRDYLDMTHLQFLVLDEADQLLDMGFIEPLRDIVAYLPERRQTYLLSATLPPLVQKISREIMHDPVKVIADERSTPDPINEVVFPVPTHQKIDLLLTLLEQENIDSMIVFARTRKQADWLYNELWRRDITAGVLHAEKTLGQRLDTLQEFHEKKFRVLLATDLAARGLDIDHVTHVLNFELPDDPQDYIHRVGRTGRIGRDGQAWSFMSADEVILVAKIERLTRKRLKERRLPDFPYDKEEKSSAPRQGRGAVYGEINHRKARSGKVESPFTKTGKAKKKYSIGPSEENKNKKKKIKIRKKFPHMK